MSDTKPLPLAPIRARLAAATCICDFVYGRPCPHVDGDKERLKRDFWTHAAGDMEALLGEVERLREALRGIAGETLPDPWEPHDWKDELRDVILMARAALGEEEK